YVQIKIYLLDKPWIQSSAAQRAVHAPEAGKRTEYIQTHRINNPVHRNSAGKRHPFPLFLKLI
ncbi:hypothetical protein, partial [Akkermansia sp.]